MDAAVEVSLLKCYMNSSSGGGDNIAFMKSMWQQACSKNDQTNVLLNVLLKRVCWIYCMLQ